MYMYLVRKDWANLLQADPPGVNVACLQGHACCSLYESILGAVKAVFVSPRGSKKGEMLDRCCMRWWTKHA